jgi:hypothetical protein
MLRAAPVLLFSLIAIHATAAEYAKPGFLGKGSGFRNANEPVFEDLGSKNVPRDTPSGFEAGSGTTTRPWAAVAINDAGRWGASITFDGPSIAIPDALSHCGSGCRIVAQGPGTCVAVALSKSGSIMFGYSYGVDRNEVQSFAMKGCTDRAPGDTCRVKFVKCL